MDSRAVAPHGSFHPPTPGEIVMNTVGEIALVILAANEALRASSRKNRSQSGRCAPRCAGTRSASARIII
jgi:hypothetical protein